MKNKLKELNEVILHCDDAVLRKSLEEKRVFLFAKCNDRIDGYRQNEISRRVQEKYPLDKQIEILLNGDVGEIALLKAYRVQMAIEVDQLIKQFESDLNSN